MAPVIAPLPADAVAPVSEEASAFEQVLARHHQITESLAMVRKLFEDLANEEPDPDPLLPLDVGGIAPPQSRCR